MPCPAAVARAISCVLVVVCLCAAPASGFVGSFASGIPSLRQKPAVDHHRISPLPNPQCRALSPRPLFTMETETITTPASILDMMQDSAKTVSAGVDGGLKRMIIELPLPVTGGTELDDWPGGMKQKLVVLRPMLAETLKKLNFTQSEIEKQEYLGISDDAIGVWKNSYGMAVVAFASPEVLPQLQALSESNSQLVLLNHQFFLDEFSAGETKQFLASCEIVYFLQSLAMKGPGLLPVKGYMVRQYPDNYKVARRTDDGGKTVIATYDERPARKDLDELFFKDSEERDKDLGLFERLKRIQKEASNI